MQQKKVSQMERLIRRTCQDKVTLFIGSGFSIKAGAPSVSNLICKLIHDGGLSYDKDISELSLRDVASDFEEENGRNHLLRILDEHFRFVPGDTSDQKLLASIPHFKTIFTTNYDTLIEDAYLKDMRCVITSSNGCAYDDIAPVKIYKLHGDLTTLNDPDSIVITNKDYEGYFTHKSFSTMWSDLKYAFVHSYVVFIGYSLADDNILDVIKQARTEVGNNLKGIYLIAPSLSKARIEQLTSNSIGAKYIQATGEDYLTALQKTLDDTIVDDFEVDKISDSKLCPEYLRTKGLEATVTLKKGANRIQDVRGIDGAPISQVINFKINLDTQQDIFNHRFNTSMTVGNTKFVIPAYEISDEKLISGEVRKNGVRFIDFTKHKGKIVIAPHNEIKTSTISVPSINFCEDTEAITYGIGNNQIVVDYDLKICNLKLTLTFDGQKFAEKLDVTVEMRDTYPSSSIALQWLEVILALYSGKKVGFGPFNIGENNINDEAFDYYTKVKRYYEAIKSIECLRGQNFKTHDNYTEDGLRGATILDSYLSKAGMGYPLVDNLKCEVDTSTGCEEAEELLQTKTPVVLTMSYIDFKLTLNGEEFKIPYVNVCLKDCLIKRVRKVSEKRYAVEFKDNAAENIIYGSDFPIIQEGNTISMQKYKNEGDPIIPSSAI